MKLGDFGLSKIMQSHDFASTYVGTPFYMSPEICAAERYTLKSDIWSLGCIIYELCSREPPFNAKSHFQLVQKIKEGKIAPLPPVYSTELNDVIKDCLKVNPGRRPDTATLLNLPVVKLMRKEKEVVELGRLLKTKEEGVTQKLRDAEERIRKMDMEKVTMRQELEASLRREWEVKAQLEINRLVQIEIERLQKKFDLEVGLKVEAELQRRSTRSRDISKETQIDAEVETLGSSVGTDGERDFPSSTDLTDLSSHSPEPTKPMKRSTRTPFGRAQTMFAGQAQATPGDIEMGEPSPISIASLSLSPRRNEIAKAPKTGRNIFAVAGSEARWKPTLLDSDASDEDELPVVPSPTRNVKSSKNPFKSNTARPTLVSQKTAPVAKHIQQTQGANLFGQVKAMTAPMLPTLSSVPDLRTQKSNSSLKERNTSPNRRLSKIPSSTNLLTDVPNPSSPQRKASVKKANGADDLNKIATKNMANRLNTATNLAPKGRTLVELAQARAGGRAFEDGTRSPEPKGRAFAQRMADKHRGSMEEVPIWNPETDDMPSPFLVRSKQIRRL